MGRWLGLSRREHLWSSNRLPWKRDSRSKKPSSPMVSCDPSCRVSAQSKMNEWEVGDNTWISDATTRCCRFFTHNPNGSGCLESKMRQQMFYLVVQGWIGLRGRVLGAGVLGRQLVLGLLALQPLEQEQLGGGFDGVVLRGAGEHFLFPVLNIGGDYSVILITQRLQRGKLANCARRLVFRSHDFIQLLLLKRNQHQTSRHQRLHLPV